MDISHYTDINFIERQRHTLETLNNGEQLLHAFEPFGVIRHGEGFRSIYVLHLSDGTVIYQSANPRQFCEVANIMALLEKSSRSVLELVKNKQISIIEDYYESFGYVMTLDFVFNFRDSHILEMLKEASVYYRKK